ncbi:Vgb family protein [Virgisporangium aliadipatigenens]|nr:hydrolase [Virgisporangium aliadipatigenens]
MRVIELPDGWAPYALAADADGGIWMTLVAPAGLARLDPAAAAGPPALHGIGADARPMQLVARSTGSVAYPRTDDRIAHLAPDGAERLDELPAGASPYGIAEAGGDLWFTATGLDRLGRLAPDGTPTWVELPAGARPAMVTGTADGAVWATLNGAGALARHHDGELEIRPLPAGAAPVGIAADGDGVWYADIARGLVGHTATGEVRLPDPACRPHAVAADPDGGCWATLWGSGELARITAGGEITIHPLPGAEPHGLVVTGGHVWVAMESGSLVAVPR